MLTIGSKDVASSKMIKYNLVLGASFLASLFICNKHFAFSMTSFVMLDVLLFSWILTKKRTRTLKIQGKRLAIEYGSSLSTEWSTYPLSELNGELIGSTTIIGQRYHLLRIFIVNQPISIIDTRNGFELERLITLLSLIRPRRDK